MATRAKKSRPAPDEPLPVKEQVRQGLEGLKAAATRRDRDNLVRFGITAPKALGVSMGNIQKVARRLGKRHELAEALWDTGWYEARMLAAFVDQPDRVTPAQMNRWCRDFDNWGICDTVCFVLFDRTPHAWAMVDRWAPRQNEFVRRAAFALIASLAGHDKTSGDQPFRDSLAHIERAASDERNFVKKGVSWALRGVGRRSVALNRDAVRLARALAESASPSARWIGKDAVRELTGPKVQRALARKPRVSPPQPG